MSFVLELPLGLRFGFAEYNRSKTDVEVEKAEISDRLVTDFDFRLVDKFRGGLSEISTDFLRSRLSGELHVLFGRGL